MARWSPAHEMKHGGARQVVLLRELLAVVHHRSAPNPGPRDITVRAIQRTAAQLHDELLHQAGSKPPRLRDHGELVVAPAAAVRVANAKVAAPGQVLGAHVKRLPIADWNHGPHVRYFSTGWHTAPQAGHSPDGIGSPGRARCAKSGIGFTSSSSMNRRWQF